MLGGQVSCFKELARIAYNNSSRKSGSCKLAIMVATMRELTYVAPY